MYISWGREGKREREKREREIERWEILVAWSIHISIQEILPDNDYLSFDLESQNYFGSKVCIGYNLPIKLVSWYLT
jgi:hypothetical protein